MTRQSVAWHRQNERTPSVGGHGTFCTFDVNAFAGVYVEYFTSKPFTTHEQVKQLAREMREAVTMFRKIHVREEDNV